MERWPLKTTPWVPAIACNRCSTPLVFPDPQYPELVAQVVWITGGRGAPVGTTAPVFFACSPSCAAVIRSKAGPPSNSAAMSFVEFLALFVVGDPQRKQLLATADRIAARGPLEQTVPYTKEEAD
jgi:hypothetical protein